jgi:hypothetical protein
MSQVLDAFLVGGFNHFTPRSPLARHLKHINPFISLIFKFFSGHGISRILTQ